MSVYAGPADWWTDGTDAGRTHIATKGIVRSGLQLNLDAGVSSSYSGTGTTWTDLTGNNNNGTLTSGPTFDSNNGGGIVFDGIDDRAITSRTNMLTGTLTEISNFLWVKLTSFNAIWNIISTIWNDGGAVNDKYTFHFAIESTLLNIYVATTNADTFAKIAQDTSAFPLNTWVMVGFTINCTTNTLNLYRNTSVVATGAYNYASIPNTTQNYLLANKIVVVTNYGFKGNIANSLLYNRALTNVEIQQNFNALRGRFGI
jgi:hypothetical protein